MITWTRYGHDFVSTDGRWRLERNRVVRIGTWWVLYDQRDTPRRYAGQTKTIKECKAWAETQLQEHP